MSDCGAAPRAAVPASNARAAASRRNGAKSRGPNTPEGKARAAQNALKHGLRAAQHVVLPDESAVEFQALEAALRAELAPEGVLQMALARRVAVAAWRLARADRMEAEVLAFRSAGDSNAGIALIRDGNGTRAVETLLRYRGAAMAEFTRALRTLKALQAEHAAGAQARKMPRRKIARDVAPNGPERPMKYVLPEPPVAGRALHEAAARLSPNEPEHRPGPNAPQRRPASCAEREPEYVLPEAGGAGRTLHEPGAPWTPNEPEAAPAMPPAPTLPVARTEQAAGDAIADPLTPSAAAGAGASPTAPGR